jgi:EmrB/QacA subfamily drug resistance transporter
MLLAAIDYSIVGTAMPTVVSSLGGLDLFSWVFVLYALVSTTFIPIFGRLSDMYGRKRLYLGGLAFFVLASALCGLAQDMTQLIAFRGLQGLGAAAIFALTFAIIGDLYPPEKRGAAQGVVASVWILAAVIGPSLGAFLVETVGWRAVFLVNLPISLIPLTTLGLMLRETPRPPARGRIDVLGALTLAGTIASFLLALPRGSNQSWTEPRTLGLLALSAILLVTFILIQRRAENPTVPLELFRRRMFTLGTISGFAFGWVAFGTSAYVPLLAQTLTGGTALDAGAALLPMTLAWSGAVLVTGPFVVTIGYRRMNLASFSFMAVGALALTQLTTASSLLHVSLASGLIGIGCGMCSVSQLLAIQNAVGANQLGVATALTMFFRNIGNSVGVSVMGFVQWTRLEQWYGGPVDTATGIVGAGAVSPQLRQAVIFSISDTFVVALVLIAIGLVSAWFMTGYVRAAPATAVNPRPKTT